LPEHLVLDLNRIGRIEKLALLKQLVRDGVGLGVQGPFLTKQLPFSERTRHALV
jgi:hypothetical protein